MTRELLVDNKSFFSTSYIAMWKEHECGHCSVLPILRLIFPEEKNMFTLNYVQYTIDSIESYNKRNYPKLLANYVLQILTKF